MEKKGMSSTKRSAVIFAGVMLAFPVLYTLVFYFGVNIKSWMNAFQITSRGKSVWSLVNFKLFLTDLASPVGEARVMFVNTFTILLWSNFIQLPLCVLCSYVFFRKIKGALFFRVMFYMPSVISMVSLTLIFYYLIDVKGPLGELSRLFGLTFPSLLGNSETAFTTIMIFNLFSGMGYTVILISGVISRLPVEIFESARLDGCKMWRELLQIVLPLVWPTVSTIFILNITNSFLYFGPVMMLTNGGPAGSTMTIGLYIYSKTSRGEYNYPSAIGLSMSVIILPVVFLLKWLFDKISGEVEF